MPFVTMKDFMGILQGRSLVAPAFNTTNLELSLAIVEGAESCGYPVIVQIAPTNLKLSGAAYISEIVKLAAEKANVPITLHLDHGMSMDDVKEAVQHGFQSVMIDGSGLPYEENIALTKEAVEYCHERHVLVEAELGTISGKEDDTESEHNDLTNPDLVKDFVERTGCDLLAVSVGNIHGLEQKASLNLNLLKTIQDKANIPLVIHGGSGIPNDTLCVLRNYGVKKVNLASDLRRKFIETVGKRYEKNKNEYNLVHVLLEAKSNVTEVVKDKLTALNSK